MGVVHKCKEINFIISAPGLKPANKTTESLDTVAKTVELDSLATDGRLLAFVLYGKIYVIDVERRSLLSTISINAVGVFLWGDRLAAISYTPSNTTVYIYNNLTAPALAATKSYPSRPSGAWLSDGVIYLVTAADEEVHIAAVDLTTGIDKEISIPTVLSPYIAHNPQAYMGRRGLYVASMRSGYEEAWAKGLEAIARYVPDAEAIYMAIRRKDLLWPITGLEPERARAVIEAAQEELHDKTFRDSTTIHVVDKSLRYMGHVEVSGLVRSIEEVGNLLVVATTEDNAISQIHYDETKGAIYVWPAPAGRHVNIYLVSIPDLKVVRSLTLAEGEVARAARTAAGVIYLSTENMLYVIDLTSLKVLDSLETYGHYLYPLSKDFLLAVGDGVRKLEEGKLVAGRNIRVTLLDVRDPGRIPERARVTLYGAISGRMALCQNNTLLIPVSMPFSTINGVAAIEITDRQMRVKTVLKRANRAVCIEDTIYAISRDSVKIYDNTLKEIATIQYT